MIREACPIRFLSSVTQSRLLRLRQRFFKLCKYYIKSCQGFSLKPELTMYIPTKANTMAIIANGFIQLPFVSNIKIYSYQKYTGYNYG